MFSNSVLLFQVSSIRMQGLLLLFFSKLEHAPFIRDIQVTYTRTGLYGYWVRPWKCKYFSEQLLIYLLKMSSYFHLHFLQMKG